MQPTNNYDARIVCWSRTALCNRPAIFRGSFPRCELRSAKPRAPTLFMLCNTNCTFLRLHSCAVARFFLPLHQLQQKTIIMVYPNFSLVGDNVPYCTSWIVYLFNRTFTQPPVSAVVQLLAPTPSELWSCAVVRSGNRASVRIIINTQIKCVLHNYTTAQPQ